MLMLAPFSFFPETRIIKIFDTPVSFITKYIGGGCGTLKCENAAICER